MKGYDTIVAVEKSSKNLKKTRRLADSRSISLRAVDESHSPCDNVFAWRSGRVPWQQNVCDGDGGNLNFGVAERELNDADW